MTKIEQLRTILEANPMADNYHTGIRTLEDIRTLAEAVEFMEEDEAGCYPDVSADDYAKALRSGFITVYSSKPIKAGTFVSPSRMMAKDYAGGGTVYQLRTPINAVAWINADEGEYCGGK